MKTKFETVSCLTYTNNGFAFIHPEQGLVKLSYLFSPPYFYVARESARLYQKVPFCSKPQNCNLKGDDGRQVYRVICKKPKQVETAREIYGVRNTYEADIQYLLRLQIDRTIKYRMDPSRIIYLDLETDDSHGFPDPERAGEYRILSVSIVDSDGIPYTYYYGDYDSEIEFLQAVLKLIEVLGATVMVGWNVMFDYRHLLKRAEHFGLNTTWLKTMYPLDLRGFYKKNVSGLESYTLEEASQHTLGVGKIERTSRVVDLPRDKLLEYNERDALLVYEIDQELNLSKEPLIVSDYLGVSPCSIYVRWDKWESMDRHLASRVGDVVIIRRLRELGYVARSRWHNPEDYEDITYQGALVGDPVPGLYENVAVYDFESLYPNVIIHEKIDMADFSGEVLPYIEEILLNYRREQKKKCKEGDEVACNIQYAVKIVLNSLYGLTGTVSYRYFDVEKASKVTSGARRQLNKLISIVRSDGKEVIYYDTDSSFILMGSDQDYEAYEELLNQRLAPYRLKWEYTFTRILFLEAKTGEGSAKKRYIGYTHDGKLVYKGLPLVRKDYPRWIKEAFKRIYLAVLDGYTQHQLKELVRELRRELYSGKVDEQLVLCKGIQRGKEYKVRAQHLKAWDKLLERGWYRGLDRVCYVITRGLGGKQEPEPVSPEGVIPRPWYAYYWRKVEEEYQRVVRSVWGSGKKSVHSLNEFF